MVNSTTAPYDLTNISQANNILDFIREVNNLTDQSLMIGVLIVGFIIAFVATKQYGNKEALMYSSFTTTVISILFTVIGFIPVNLGVFIIIAFVLFFVLVLRSPD